jgi:hypothetical protein
LLLVSSFWFGAVLDFELRTLCLPDRHSTTWSTPPALFAFLLWLFLKKNLTFYPGQPGLQPSYVKLPTIIGITGVNHYTQLLVDIGSCELFSLQISLPK